MLWVQTLLIPFGGGWAPPQKMSTLYAFWFYFYSLFTVVVLNCLHPLNWQQCFTTNWLLPYLNDYIEFRMLPPYEAERRALSSVKKPPASGAVDQRWSDDP